MKDLELWQFVAQHLQQKQDVVLLVVAESSGSSPGRQGFKMAVAEDEMCGSIGGGVMEVALVELAKSQVSSLKSQVIEQVHRKNVPNSSGMICSGTQTVIFYQFTFEDLRTVRKLIQKTTSDTGRYLAITSNSFQLSWPKRFGEDYKFTKSENDFRYSERLGHQQKLFIIGGGHCALALSEMAAKLGFYITVFDDRPDLNTLQKNKFADRIEIIEAYEKIGGLIDSDPTAYVVVMTLGYKFDEIVIRQLFDKNFKYFGVLGSKAKMKTLLRTLGKEGFDKERLARIHTPIGLKINSRTPEEIAISIAAEIISVKNAN